ncbi:MAG: PCYCGC domain-containing protein [Candidatus Obscuribacterales bacterium]|nr:PCYCGC domain-containing protein [Candidatus Obscuribacterales bacterium]
MIEKLLTAIGISLGAIFTFSLGTAFGMDAKEQLKPVLNPEKYFGKAKLGYMAAQRCPEICAKLFCYCGCDVTDEHGSLLDCFTSDHGVDCYICQEEALVALQMKKDGKSLAEIQKVIDQSYEKQYPFDATEILLKYRRERLWQPQIEKQSSNGKEKSPRDANPKNVKDKNLGNTSSAMGKRVLPSGSASGANHGGCCGKNSVQKTK